MNSGTITLHDGPREIDLQSTLESAQSFLWQRVDDRMYENASSHGGEDWYYTVVEADIVFVRQQNGQLEWRSTIDATAHLRWRLRLDDNLHEIFASFPTDQTLDKARRIFPGLRVVRDPFFPCLISFICSARTTVERIHALRLELARTFGDAVTVNGSTYHSFPQPAQLATASETALRELGLGFRAPYVKQTAQIVASGELTGRDLRRESYYKTHEQLQAFPGVGPKIADCVSLFALGHLEAVPIDTWTRTLIEQYYPEMAHESDESTASAFRDRFGDFAGYAQTYLYYFVRS